MRRSRARAVAGLALAAAAAAVPAACNIVGGAAYLIHGPEKVPKMYDLDESRPTAVFIDDRVPVTPTRSVRRIIGETAEKMLTDKGEIKTAIRSSDLLAIAEQDRFGQPTGITEIGTRAGAEILIYVVIDQFTISADRQTFSPTASCRVKVMDCKEKKRLWPDPGATGGSEWQGVSVSPPSRQGPPPPSPSERTKENERLASKLGEAVANLFIKHEKRPIGKRISE